jgi:predicted metal-dependent hydrolase
LSFFSKKDKFDGLVFPEFVEVNANKYLIEVEFSKKRSSSVVIKDTKLIFRMSSYLTKGLAEKHFSDLLKKIYKKLELMRSEVKRFLIEEVLEKGSFRFSNEIYTIEMTNKVRGVKLVENVFYVNYKTKISLVEKHFIKLLVEKYSSMIKAYVDLINSKTFNYDVSDVELKFVSSKWGHCTHDNKIMINLKLLNAPIEILNYVIIHELAHIKVKNHSQKFWNEVSRFTLNFKNSRRFLRKNPPQLFYEVENYE